ncbi:hypothetical protein BGL39_05940 [Fructilactobacillus sanfranciscensis]|nr:hypothetical protein BGL39_05940 [Fructilactobacillus sanfranciscensis]
MSDSITLHVGDTVDLPHDNREHDNHQNKDINVEDSDRNIVIKYYENEQEAYDDIFGEAVEEFNKKQKHKNRRIKNYLEKIKTTKVGFGEHKEFGKPLKQMIIEIGKAPETDLGERQKHIIDVDPQEAEFRKLVQTKYIENFEKRNPNIKLVNVSTHVDEANIHSHMTFIPFFHSNRGLRKKFGLNGAIREMVAKKRGVPTKEVKDAAQDLFRDWSENERNEMVRIAKEIRPDFEREVVGAHAYLKPKEFKAVRNLERSIERQKNNRVEKIIDNYSEDSSPAFLLTNEDGEVITEDDESELYSVPVFADFEVTSEKARKYLKKATDKQLEFYEGYFEQSRELDFEDEEKRFNCEMIREYEPEARVEYSKKDDNEEPRKSDPIKIETGFRAFMHQPLEWLKKEKEKYKKIFKEKIAQFKKEKLELDEEREAIKQEKQEATKLKNEFSIYGNFDLGDTIEQKYEYNENLGWYRKTGSGRWSDTPINPDKAKLKPNDFIKYEKRTKTVKGKIIGYSNYDENDNLNNFIILQNDNGKKEKVVLGQGGSPKLVKKGSDEERKDAISNEIKENKPLSKFPNEAIEQAKARKYEIKRSGHGMNM